MAAAELLLHLLNAACLEYKKPRYRPRERQGAEKRSVEEFREREREREHGGTTE